MHSRISHKTLSLLLKGLVIVHLLLVISGCATTNQFVVAQYNTTATEKFPNLSVFYQHPPKALRTFCEEFDQKSLLHHCSLNDIGLNKFHNALDDSQLFEGVYYANQDVDYKLLISTAHYNHEGGDELGQAVIAGATLMLAPVIVNTDIKVDASLTWNGQVIKHMQYDLPFTNNITLFTAQQDHKQDMATSVVSHIIRDFQQENLFSASLLYQKLDATDYTTATLPETTRHFIRSDHYQFHHPFNGLMTRYTHKTFEFDHIDAFIYPIRHWDLNNDSFLLSEELDNYKREMEIYLKEAKFSELNIIEATQVSIENNNTKIPAAYLKATYQTDEQQSVTTILYIFRNKDKFVKVRSTYESEANLSDQVVTFSQELASRISVPDESLYMMKARKMLKEASLKEGLKSE
ncbi:hypothetical protein [Marinibactrum halimedae]|uniref:Uncharacterized protein n=1 Tax=Marinibactrum halimedae TaxID=1444977 RepID=A0AA37T9J5_9GAMM|nr:hypothetical protein [Marinibactrum halimedae]MCD9461148.1 hypothetical protein [Marinibactrum halimedae]GLS26035.1 hypothetical protein GCM10007877_17500 [Marinibactrum halimedae]